MGHIGERGDKLRQHPHTRLLLRFWNASPSPTLSSDSLLWIWRHVLLEGWYTRNRAASEISMAQPNAGEEGALTKAEKSWLERSFVPGEIFPSLLRFIAASFAFIYCAIKMYGVCGRVELAYQCFCRVIYIYIYTQTKNNFRKEILRNDKFINFGKWYSYQKRKLYPFFDLNLNCFYFNATKIFESFLSFSLFLFYTINSDFKLYVEFRSEKVSVNSFHSFNIFFFSNCIVNQGALSRFHEDVEISGGNLSDKYEYVTVSKVWTLPHSCDWRLICTS